MKKEAENKKRIQDKFPWERYSCFVDQFMKPCAEIKFPDHSEVFRVSSGFVKASIAAELEEIKVSATAENVNTIRGLMEARAYKSYRTIGQVHLHLRVKIKKNEQGDLQILLDKGDRSWHLVYINSEGYSEESIRNPSFIRYSTTAPFNIDLTGSRDDFERYFSLLNTGSYRDLIKAWTLSALIPGYPHFIIMFLGTKGSGKSTNTVLLKQLIDPSPVGTLGRPHNEDSLFLSLAHNYLVAYDNLDSIGENFASTLARAITGEGIQRRQLYTDEDDMLYRFQRLVILNAINQPTRRADLLDRTLIFELGVINQLERMEEQEIYKQASVLVPKAIGYIIKTLPSVLREYKSIHENLKDEVPLLPRMADATVWMEAAGRALGYGEGYIYNKLLAFLKSEGKGVLESSELGGLVLQEIELLLKDKSEVEITPSEFLSGVQYISGDLRYAKDVRGRLIVPDSTNELGRFLHAVASNLEDAGFSFIRKVGSDNRKMWVFRKLLTKSIGNSSVILNADGKLPELPELPTSPNFKGDKIKNNNWEKGVSSGGTGNFGNSTVSNEITSQLPTNPDGNFSHYVADPKPQGSDDSNDSEDLFGTSEENSPDDDTRDNDA